MKINVDKIKSADLKRRFKTLKLPDVFKPLLDDPGQTPEIEIQNLTGEEVAFMRLREKQNLAKDELLQRLFSKNIQSQVDAVCESLGISDVLPSDFVKSVALFEYGTVDPAIDQEVAVRFARLNAVEFYRIVDEISVLTGIGCSLGE